jgi:hypothetical protein
MTPSPARSPPCGHVPEERLERLAGGDLSEVLLLRRPDGRCTVAKGGPAVGDRSGDAARAGRGRVPVPRWRGSMGVLLLEHVPNDGVFSPAPGRASARRCGGCTPCTGESYGWPVDYRARQRRAGQSADEATGPLLGRAAARRDRRAARPAVARAGRALVPRLAELLPAAPPPRCFTATSGAATSWSRKAAARRVDRSGLLSWHARSIWRCSACSTRRRRVLGRLWRAGAGLGGAAPAYQLFPALVHLRLFGAILCRHGRSAAERARRLPPQPSG